MLKIAATGFGIPFALAGRSILEVLQDNGLTTPHSLANLQKLSTSCVAAYSSEEDAHGGGSYRRWESNACMNHHASNPSASNSNLPLRCSDLLRCSTPNLRGVLRSESSTAKTNSAAGGNNGILYPESQACKSYFLVVFDRDGDMSTGFVQDQAVNPLH